LSNQQDEEKEGKMIFAVVLVEQLHHTNAILLSSLDGPISRGKISSIDISGTVSHQNCDQRVPGFSFSCSHLRLFLCASEEPHGFLLSN
jgi:hypothetical protein